MAKFKRTLQISVLSAIMFFCGVMGILLGARTGVGKVRAEEAETVRVEYVMSAAELAATSRWRSDTWIAAGVEYASLVNNADYVTVTASSNDSQLWYYNNYAKIKGKTNIEVTYRVASSETKATKFRVRPAFGATVDPTIYSDFTLIKDGDWHTTTMSLANLADDAVTQVRFDPLAGGDNGDYIDIQSIRFYADGIAEELTVCGRTNSNAQYDYNINQINGTATDGNNNKLNGWTSTVTEPTDFVLNGWMIIKSDDGSVGIDHYEYKIDDGAWTAIEGGIGAQRMWFTNGEGGHTLDANGNLLDAAGNIVYIPDGKYNQATTKIDNLTVPTKLLGKGVYTVSLRAITTNFKTVTVSWTYEFVSAPEIVHNEYIMTASDLMKTSNSGSAAGTVNSKLELSADGTYVTATDDSGTEPGKGDPQLWYYNSVQKIKFLPNVEITYRLKTTPANNYGRFYLFKTDGSFNQVDISPYVVGDTWNTIKVTLPEDDLADLINIRFDYLEGTNVGDSIDIQSIRFYADGIAEELTVCGRTDPNAQYDYIIDSINGTATNGTNNKLNGWTSTVTEPTDFVLNGWMIIKSDDGSVGIDHYEYKIDDGAWTAIEGGIGAQRMWFTNGEGGHTLDANGNLLDAAGNIVYIPDGKYNQATTKIDNLTVPTKSLGKGVYTISLRAVTTNFKTVTLSFTYNCQYLVTYGDTGSVEYVTAGETATESVIPQKGGYTFVEWQLNGEKYNFDSPVNGDITLEARYKIGNISEASLSLEGDIAVNLYIALPDGGATAVRFMLGENTTEIPVPAAADGDGRYKFSFGVAAKDYTEAIGVSVIPAEETEEGISGTLTVKKIGDTYLNSVEIGEEVKAVVTAMLTYCESARTFFAGEEVTEEYELSDDLSAYAEKAEGSVDTGVTLTEAALVLESQTSIKVYFSVQSGLSLTYGIDGEEVEPVCYEEDEDGTKYYYLEKANIAAKDLGKTYVFEIGSVKLSYSAISYVRRVLRLDTAGAALKNTVIALYNYYQAAGLYFYGYDLESGGSFVTFADIPPQSNYTALIEDYAALGLNTYTLIASEGYYDSNGYYVGNGLMADDNGEITEEYKTAIGRIQALGLNVFIRNADNSVSYFDSVTDEFINLGVDGFFIVDEPAYFDGFTEGYPDMPSLRNLVDWYNTYYAGTGMLFHCNLYGSVVEETADGYFLTNPINKNEKITYEQYIQYYIEHFATKVKGPVTLCFDNYPFRAGTTVIRGSWFSNLLYIANQAKAANATRVGNGMDASVVMGFCVQTFGSNVVKDISCAEEVSVQLCVGMAMGAGLFEYYLYSTIDAVGGDGVQNGIIDGDGTKRIYSYVKEANDKYLPFQKVLSGFGWQGLAAISGSQESENSAVFAAMDGQTGITDMGLASVESTRDCVVGYFTRGEYKGYMIANCAYSSPDKTNTVTVRLGDYSRAIVYTAGGERKLVNAVNGTIEIELEAGGGAFIVPVE